MTIDEKLILELTRENERLKMVVEELRDSIVRAESEMRKVGVPGFFEDGNDSDDISFNEQVSILCDMYTRASTKPMPANGDGKSD